MTLEEFRTLKPGDEIIMRYPTGDARDNFFNNVPEYACRLDTLIVNRFPVMIDKVNMTFKENPIFSIHDFRCCNFSWKWADTMASKNNEILEFATDEEFMSLFE